MTSKWVKPDLSRLRQLAQAVEVLQEYALKEAARLRKNAEALRKLAGKNG